jgi:DNA-binding NtrC family response regulator
MSSRVLIVDPDPSVRRLLVALMRRAGYLTDAAEDQEEALALHRRLPHDAVIVEPRNLGGAALLEKLDDGTANLIVVTTPDGVTIPYRDTRGVRTVLFKPFRIDDLAAAVASCCDGAN